MFIPNYTKLMRFKTSFLIGLSSILGAWLNYSQNKIELSNIDILFKLIAVFLLIVLSSGSLNLFNDIKDLKIDKELKPERILPQEIVSIQKAYLFFFLMTICCVIFALSLNLIVFVIYIIMLGIGVCYSLFLENLPLIKNIVVGLSIAMSIIVGYLSLIINLDVTFTHRVLVIFFLSFFSIIAFEIQKDINDVEIDQKYNKVTFPVIFGKKKSSVLVYVMYWLILLLFWSYLVFYTTTAIYLSILLIIIQTIFIISIRKIVVNQSKQVLEEARIRIYILFAITLVASFLVT